MDETGIAWSSDIKKKFGSQLPSNFNTEEYASNRGGSTISGEAAAHVQAEHGTWGCHDCCFVNNIGQMRAVHHQLWDCGASGGSVVW